MCYGKLQYCMKWLGYDEDLNWYPASDFWNYAMKVQLFHHHKPQALGPPKCLIQWLEAAENDEFLYDDLDDDLPVNGWGSHSSQGGGDVRAVMGNVQRQSRRQSGNARC